MRLEELDALERLAATWEDDYCNCREFNEEWDARTAIELAATQLLALLSDLDKSDLDKEEEDV